MNLFATLLLIFTVFTYAKTEHHVTEMSKVDQFREFNDKKSNDKKAAQALGNSIVHRLELNSENVELLRFLPELGWLNYELGHFDLAIDCYQKALMLAQQYHQTEKEALFLNHLGNFYYEKGDFITALSFYARSLDLYIAFGQEIRAAAIKNNIGLMYSSMGDLFQAAEYFQQALSVYYRLDAQSDTADVLLNIAGIHNRLEEFKKAQALYNKALMIYQKIEDTDGIAHVNGNLGVAYLASKNYQKAQQYFEEALALHTQLNKHKSIIVHLKNLADLHSKIGQDQIAEEYIIQAIEQSSKFGIKEMYASSLYTQSSIFLQQGELKFALAAAEESLKVARAVNEKIVTRDVLYNMSLIYTQMGNYELALKHYVEFNELENGILNNASAEKLAQFRIRFDVEQNEHELALLKAKNKNQMLELAQNKWQRNSLILALVMACLFAFLFYKRQVHRKANELLEENVRLRTQELDGLNQKYLNVAREKKKQLEQVNHSIRRPLSHIYGLSDSLLVGDVAPDIILNEIQAIKSECEKITEFANKLGCEGDHQVTSIKIRNKTSLSQGTAKLAYFGLDLELYRVIQYYLSQYQSHLLKAENQSELEALKDTQNIQLVLLDPAFELYQQKDKLVHIFDIVEGIPCILLSANTDLDVSPNNLVDVIRFPLRRHTLIESLQKFLVLESKKGPFENSSPSFERLQMDFKRSLSDVIQSMRLGLGNRDLQSLLKTVLQLQRTAHLFGFKKIELEAKKTVNTLRLAENNDITEPVYGLITCIQSSLSEKK